jgi:hypothetical protein
MLALVLMLTTLGEARRNRVTTLASSAVSSASASWGVWGVGVVGGGECDVCVGVGGGWCVVLLGRWGSRQCRGAQRRVREG